MVATAARAARRVPVFLRRRAVLVPVAVGLLAAHFVGIGLAGFTQGRFKLAIVVTVLGLLAVPFCAWDSATV